MRGTTNMKRLFYVLLSLMFYSVSYAVIYWQDDFESQSTQGDWDALSGASASHVIETSTNTAKFGSRSLRCVDTATTGNTGACLTKNFTPAITGNMYIRFYYYLPVGHAAAGGSRTLARVYSGSKYVILGTAGIAPMIHENTRWDFVKFTTTTYEGAWTCFEAKFGTPAIYNYPNTNNLVDYWIDGIFSTTSIPSGQEGVTTVNFTGSGWNQLLFGDVYELWSTAGIGEFYLDGLVVANRAVGLGQLVLDTSSPTAPGTVRDGTGEIDAVSGGAVLSANWDASSDAESGIYYYEYAIGTTAGSTDVLGWTSAGSTTTVSKSGLTVSYGQSYYFSVRAVNGDGLVGQASCSNGQQGTGIDDNTAPVISALTSANLQAASAKITWTTDESATSHVEYGVTAVYGQQSTVDSGLGTSHSVNITGLTAGTTYFYRVKSADSYGNVAVSAVGVFSTTTGSAVQKPYPVPCDFKNNNMTFIIDGTGGGNVKIFTLDGALARTLDVAAGNNSIDWDGKNSSGQNAVSGVYLYIASGSSQKKGKILVVR